MARSTRRKPKKKQISPVVVWTGVSVGILVLVCIALALKLMPGPPDRRTDASSEANIAKVELADDLPSLGELNSGDGSIDELFMTVADTQAIMRAGGFDEEKKKASARVAAALAAAASSDMPDGLLDKRVPDKRFDSPELKADLQALSGAVNRYVDESLEALEFDAARQACLAQVRLGRDIFESNTRLKIRQSGLAMMRSALSKLSAIERAAYDDGEIDQEALKKRNTDIMAWLDAVKAVNDAWNVKLMSIETVASSEGKPNTADLKAIALSDQDKSFRVFAARRMGYALFERGDQGNQKFLKKTIEELKAGSDQAVADAAKHGNSIKDRNEYHELRK